MPSYRKSTTRSRRSHAKRSSYRSRRAAKYSKRRRAGYRAWKVRMFRSSGTNPLALSTRCRLTYNDLNFGVGLTSVSGYANSYEFRANFLYDPDKTGVGVQPYGYDQMVGAGGSSLFSAYRVYASKIRIYLQRLVTNPSTTNDNAAIRVCVVPWRDETFTYSSFDDVMRLPHAKAITYKGSDESHNNKIESYIDVKTLFPIGANVESLWAYYNATPSNPALWRIYFDGSSTLTADSTINFDVKITYYCKLWKLQPVNES